MIVPGASTFTFAEALKPGAVTVITAVPGVPLVIDRPMAVEDSLMKTLERTKATAGLLEVTVKLMPPGGAGLANTSVRMARSPF